MLTLCMDTSYKYLSLSLIENDIIIASINELCFKKQSEMIFVKLQELFDKTNYQPLDIDSVCICKGPGSYTGVRIAMTIAKVICEIKKIDLYTISTLRLYANNKADTSVIMDARANRVYFGHYDKDKIICEDKIINLDELDRNLNLVGDLSLIGQEDKMDDIAECFLNTKATWHKEDNIAYVIPTYLKESDDYYR